MKIVHEDIIDTVKQYLFDKEDIGIRLVINSHDRKLVEKVNGTISGKKIVSKVVKMLRDYGLLSKEDKIDEMMKEINGLGKRSNKKERRKGSQNNQT